MAIYTKDELRKIFQTPFNRESWKAILHNLFRADMIRTTSEKFTDDDDPEEGYYMGALNTADSFRIGLFYYKISSGSVAHKRVGLRNLVCKFINESWGEFDAAIVVFNDGIEWRLSFVCDIKDVATTPKRFTYVFGEHDNFYRTPVERFYELQSKDATFETIRDTFSVDALSDDFFNAYRELYADFVQYITGKRYVKESNRWVERELSEPNYQFESTFDGDEKLVRDYIKKMFGRIVFLYFLQRKGWLNGDRQYMHNLYYNSDQKDNFLDGVLETLFFEVLNTDKPYRTDAVKSLPGSENIPYLNGGLFAQDDIDLLDCIFPEDYFKKIFDFLDSYNFTIDENDTEDAEIGIDPEMLGRIFENLLEDNKDKGAFYTPKPIVDYMCRECIIAYLQDSNFKEEGNALIRKFVETYDSDLLSFDQRKYIKNKLKAVKICDPAIGSGAFPMGLVNLLSKLYAALKISTDASEIKRHIMEQSIYGVDIEKGAVDIARLRFWLAMIVEEKDPIPLPNLHFKIMQGNSLLESYKGVDLSDLTKVDNQSSLFDSTNAEREDLLLNLRKYYGTSDHTERDWRFTSIIRNVRRQIYAKNPNISQENFDPSENDKFFLWHTWFADIFDNGGFDIVICNPPYLKERENKHVFDIVNQSPFGRKYHRGKMDFWFYFMHLALEISHKNTIIEFITSRYWIKSSGAKKIINQIRNTSSIIQIVDIGNLKVFDNVVGHHMITSVRANTTGLPCQYYLLADDVHNIEKKEFEVITKITHDKLFSNNDEICISQEENKYSTGLTLGDIAEVAQGVVEASDKISSRMYKNNPLEGFNIGDGIFVLNSQEISSLSLSKEEMKCIHPYLGDGCIKPYCITPSDKFLIYSDKDLRQKIEQDDKFIHLRHHLDRFSAYITSSNKPYGLHRPRKIEHFTSAKIIGPSMFKEPTFAVDNNGIFVGMSYNVILPIAADDIYYILSLLNSKFAKKWFNTNSKHRGVGNDVGVDKLRTFPIPICVASTKAELINYAKMLTDSMLDEKILDSIDIIVFHLYAFSYDDILIIDPDTTITRAKYDAYKID